MKPWTEHPCTQCDGYGWVEEPSYFAQGRTDGQVIYHRATCEQCKGSGEEPGPDENE